MMYQSPYQTSTRPILRAPGRTVHLVSSCNLPWPVFETEDPTMMRAYHICWAIAHTQQARRSQAVRYRTLGMFSARSNEDAWMAWIASIHDTTRPCVQLVHLTVWSG